MLVLSFHFGYPKSLYIQFLSFAVLLNDKLELKPSIKEIPSTLR